MKVPLNIADLSPKGGNLYYHPSILTINDYIICLSAVIFPELLFPLFFLTLPGIRYFRYSVKLIMPVTLITIVCILIFLVGSKRLAGGGASLWAGLYYFFVRIIPLFYLVEGSFQKRSARVQLFIKISLIYLLASFIIDFIFFKNNYDRALLLLGHLSVGNSTNFINLLVLIISSLLIVRDKHVYLYLLLTFFISFAWDNRTGLLCCGVLFLFYTLKRSRLLAVAFLALSFFLVPLIIENTRFGDYGLTSPRWLAQLDALQELWDLKNPFGGYDNYLGDNDWLHNIYLDAYRVAGVIPAFLLLIFSIVPFFYLRSDRLYFRILCMLSTIIIGMSSIMIEGSHLEFLFLFILLYNPQLILGRGQNLTQKLS